VATPASHSRSSSPAACSGVSPAMNRCAMWRTPAAQAAPSAERPARVPAARIAASSERGLPGTSSR
jgi:hypothetical protein